MIGRHNQGKTTLVNLLKNLCYVADSNISTKIPELHEIDLSGYKFRVLDTPGLDIYKNEDTVQSIKTTAEKFFGGEGFENIDTVIVPFSIMFGWKPGAMSDMIENLLPNFPKKAKKIFVITHAESSKEVHRNDLRNQICQTIQISHLINNYFRGKENILFSGTLQLMDIVQAALHPSAINEKFNYLYPDRERLIEELLPCPEPDEVKDSRTMNLEHDVKQFINEKVFIEPLTPQMIAALGGFNKVRKFPVIDLFIEKNPQLKAPVTLIKDKKGLPSLAFSYYKHSEKTGKLEKHEEVIVHSQKGWEGRSGDLNELTFKLSYFEEGSLGEKLMLDRSHG